MRKKLFFALLTVALMLVSGTALADSIAGRVGLSGQVGFLIPQDSDFDDLKLETDAGFVGGGGIIYGIDKNYAAELNVTYTEFGSNTVSGINTGDFSIIDVALGGQYRFQLAQRELVPFVGAGLDILLTSYDPPNGVKADVDNMVGVHVSGGVDYFLTKQLALSAEARVIVSPTVDISETGTGKRGHFDPSSFSGMFGFRLFFN